MTDNLPVRTFSNKTEEKTLFEIKTGSYIKLLMTETMKLLGSTRNKLTKDKNCEKVPHLEIAKVVIAYCNIVNNDYQRDSRLFYIFVPNRSFCRLLNITPKSFIFLKPFNSEFYKL